MKNKQVFVINGSGGAGKDTFIEFVETAADFGVLNYSSIDKMKQVALGLGWNNKGKTEKDRKLLADLKKLSTEYNDLPFRSLIQTVKDFYWQEAEVLFLHIREPEEIKRAVEAFGAKTILVRRDSIDTITSNEADKNVFDYDYDIEIFNNGGLDNLFCQAEEFVEYVHALFQGREV